jgi:hypothetical protein
MLVEDADDQDFHDHEVFRMATLAGITIKYGVEVNYDLPCLL